MRREKRGGFYGVGFDLDSLNKYNLRISFDTRLTVCLYPFQAGW